MKNITSPRLQGARRAHQVAQLQGSAPRLKLRRMRSSRGRVWPQDRVLAIVHDSIADERSRYARVFRRGQKIVVFLAWVGEGERFTVRLHAPYSQAGADRLIEALRRGCVSRRSAGVFVDLRPDGYPPETAIRIMVHLLRDGGCEQCGLPPVVVKRQPGDVVWPFEDGVRDCDRWPQFLAPDPHREPNPGVTIAARWTQAAVGHPKTPPVVDRSSERPPVDPLRWPSRLATLPRPAIDVRDHDLRSVANRAWGAVRAANDPPFLFTFGGAPHWIEAERDGGPFLRHVTQDGLRHVLARVGDWYTISDKQRVSALPPVAVVRDLLATPNPPLPVLSRIVATPVFTAAGRILIDEGYDPESRLIYAPRPGFVVPPVSPRPTSAELRRALAHVGEVLYDFPLVQPADLAHALALYLLPFVRELIEGPTPLHLFEKSTPGTGASLLLAQLVTLATGGQATVMTEGRGEEEWRKRLTAKLLRAPSVLWIDNLKHPLDSAALSAALTASVWEDRLLGRSQIVHVPVRCAWTATGNNPSLSNEMARRTISSRLDAREARPWQRTGFRHPDLPKYTREYRPELVWAALTLGQTWIAEGCPPGTKTLGMFEDWARVLGGILGVAGVDGFLDNLESLYKDADTENAALEALVSRWWAKHSGKPIGAADVYPMVVDPQGGDPIDIDLGRGSERSRRTTLGKRLLKMQDRHVGGYRIVKAGTRQGAQLWRLVPA